MIAKNYHYHIRRQTTLELRIKWLVLTLDACVLVSGSVHHNHLQFEQSPSVTMIERDAEALKLMSFLTSNFPIEPDKCIFSLKKKKALKKNETPQKCSEVLCGEVEVFESFTQSQEREKSGAFSLTSSVTHTDIECALVAISLANHLDAAAASATASQPAISLTLPQCKSRTQQGDQYQEEQESQA